MEKPYLVIKGAFKGYKSSGAFFIAIDTSSQKVSQVLCAVKSGAELASFDAKWPPAHFVKKLNSEIRNIRKDDEFYPAGEKIAGSLNSMSKDKILKIFNLVHSPGEDHLKISLVRGQVDEEITRVYRDLSGKLDVNYEFSDLSEEADSEEEPEAGEAKPVQISTKIDLDPVKGKKCSAIAVGESIILKPAVQEELDKYRGRLNFHREEQGIKDARIIGEVTGTSQEDTGRYVIKLKIGNGITSIQNLSGEVKLSVISPEPELEAGVDSPVSEGPGVDNARMIMILGAGVIVIVLLVVIALLIL